MSTRKNTKFNKVNGYKDFTFSRRKLKHDVYTKMTNSKNDNIPDNMLDSKTPIPIDINIL